MHVFLDPHVRLCITIVLRLTPRADQSLHLWLTVHAAGGKIEEVSTIDEQALITRPKFFRI